MSSYVECTPLAHLLGRVLFQQKRVFRLILLSPCLYLMQKVYTMIRRGIGLAMNIVGDAKHKWVDTILKMLS